MSSMPNEVHNIVPHGCQARAGWTKVCNNRGLVVIRTSHSCGQTLPYVSIHGDFVSDLGHICPSVIVSFAGT